MLAPPRCWARLERWHKSWCALRVGEWEGSAHWGKWHRAGAWERRLWQEKHSAAGYRKMWDSADSLYLMLYFLTASPRSCCRLLQQLLLSCAGAHCLHFHMVEGCASTNCRLSFCGKCHCGAAVPSEVQDTTISSLVPHLCHLFVKAWVRDLL